MYFHLLKKIINDILTEEFHGLTWEEKQEFLAKVVAKEKMPILKFMCWHQLNMIHAGLGIVSVFSPSTVEELQKVISFSNEFSLPLYPVGLGSNLLGSDLDCGVLVLNLSHLHYKISHPLPKEQLRISCAESLPRLAHQLLSLGLGGLAPLSGIPAALGGALRMNAGANGTHVGEFVQAVYGFNLLDGTEYCGKFSDKDWAYRQSPIPKNILITAADLLFFKRNPTEEKAAIQKEHMRRIGCTPKGHSAGSVFRNPSSCPAGKLLEDSGCKELPPCGVFQVSPEHANWIVNYSGKPGRTEDARKLVKQMQKRVADKYQIQLQLEWQFVPQAEGNAF
ncbi:MAG: FAD-binding protein [Lentisphaeria bacterium]